METISRSLLTFLLNSLWQIALVTAIAALICRWLRGGPAGHRHAIWVTALVAGLLLPVMSMRMRAPAAAIDLPVPRLSPDIAAAPPLPPRSSTLSAAIRPSPQPDGRSVPLAPATATAVLAAYLLFVVYRIIRFGRAWLATVRIRRAAESRALPELVEHVRARCQAALGVSGVELLASPDASSPLSAGAWRRTIVLPESLMTATDADVLTTAIGHEMSHIARHDFALHALYELLQLPIAFHPATWIVRRGIGRTREMACDELVTARLIAPRAYARSLARIAAAMIGSKQPGYALGVFDGDILEERIRRLIEEPAVSLKRARLLLAAGLSALALCAVLASGLTLTAHAQSAERDEMRLAVQSYNNGDFAAAAQHFQNAANLAPSDVTPKLFLAHTLMREMNGKPPGDPLIAAIRRQYQDVLALDPQNRLAVQGMVVVEMAAVNAVQARQWADKLIQADPKEKGAYYTAAVVDWATVFPQFQRAKQLAGARPEDYLIPDANARKNIRDQYLPQIEDGIRMLDTALQLDPNYSDAMAYMNLLDRMKSGMVDDPVESANLLAQADQWVGKALAARKRSVPLQHQPPLDVDGPPPGPFGSANTMIAAPPPPPPPPPPTAFVGDNQPASAVAPPAMHNTAEIPGTFWQVTGAADLSAFKLFQQLRAQSFKARVVVLGPDRLARVMVGPYADRESLQEGKTALEAAGFSVLRTW